MVELAYTKKKIVSKEDLDENLELMAYQMAVFAEIIKDYRVAPPNFRPAWQQMTEATRTSAIELAEATKAKDGAKAFAAAQKLDGSCQNCHNFFRAGGGAILPPVQPNPAPKKEEPKKD